MLRPANQQAAIEAYIKSINNGDPGSKGYWLAGQESEEMGVIESAIRFYLFSRWQGAHDRADKLESTLINR